MEHIHIIYMAAGNSRRFNGNKLLHKIDGKAIYRYGFDRLLDFLERHEESTLTVVTQYETIVEEIRALLSVYFSGMRIETVMTGMHDFVERYHFHDAPHGRIQVVFHSNSTNGVSYTIRAGICAIENNKEYLWNPDRDLLMFVVADQPWLSLETVEKLAGVREFNAPEYTPGSDSDVFETAMITCGSRAGNPTLFHGTLAEELKNLSEDEGGRKVIRRHRCVLVEIEDEKELLDIDTRKDLVF